MIPPIPQYEQVQNVQIVECLHEWDEFYIRSIPLEQLNDPALLIIELNACTRKDDSHVNTDRTGYSAATPGYSRGK